MTFRRTLFVGAVLLTALSGLCAWQSRADDRDGPRDRREGRDRRERKQVTAAKAAGPADPALVKRGDYLVNQLARCGDCHTPRDGRGQLDNSRRMQGAQVWFTPKVRPREWEGNAPDLTTSGRGGRWSEARWVKFLTTGGDAEAPMPAYHMTPDDARAVAVYLRSLPGRKGGAKGRERDDD
jgi:mono/diheme cytochrome c family protein